ncbi:site-specific DNA-methyltransferase [Candidatus Poriferisocius sp.]|uniref:site-specific DNA-methyltransferase n=1 Tax=Candidatus Poriferisocius sp. TaxID=3101276 RepID=UPI003B5AFF69
MLEEGALPRLNFKGRVFVENHHLAVPFHELLPVRDKGLSEQASLHDNLIVHGDNLAALKSLLPTYHGKVKCIYIDPPYNTGKEGWAYNDKVNSPLMQDWLGRVVDRDDLTRHDKWCCMMLPRLKLLRELLREDGVIFVSIDDNEVHHLSCLMDEVFGENNRVGQIIWHGSTDNNPTNIATEHEYIVCYAANKPELEEVWKSASFGPKEVLQRIGAELLESHPEPEERQQEYSRWLREHKAQVRPLDRYKFIDEGGVFTGSQSVHNPGREGYRYDVIHPKTGKPCKEPLMGYRFPLSTMNEMLAEDRVIFGADETKIIEIKAYVDDYEAKLGSVIQGIDSRRGANEMRGIFPEVLQVFKNPKPSTLIAELLSFATDPDSIVLDSFAGSGTTAQAVLAVMPMDLVDGSGPLMG